MTAQVIPFPLERRMRVVREERQEARDAERHCPRQKAARQMRSAEMQDEFRRRYNIAAAKLQTQGGLK